MSPAKNLLVMQSGGPTPVINRSLFGVCDEAAKSGAFAGILGAHGGTEGVLGDRVYDLAAVSTEAWQSIAMAPGAALGTTRKKFADADLPRAIDFIERRRDYPLAHHRGQRLRIDGADGQRGGERRGPRSDRAPRSQDRRQRPCRHGPFARLRQRGSVHCRGDTRGRTRRRSDGTRSADHRDRGRGPRLRLAGLGVRTGKARQSRRSACCRHTGNAFRPVARPVCGSKMRIAGMGSPSRSSKRTCATYTADR